MTRHLISGPHFQVYCGAKGVSDPATYTGFVTAVTCPDCLTAANRPDLLMR